MNWEKSEIGELELSMKKHQEHLPEWPKVWWTKLYDNFPTEPYFTRDAFNIYFYIKFLKQWTKVPFGLCWIAITSDNCTSIHLLITHVWPESTLHVKDNYKTKIINEMIIQADSAKHWKILLRKICQIPKTISTFFQDYGHG